MFHTLRKLLNRGSGVVTAASGHIIDRRETIVELLSKIHDSHTLLIAEFADSQERFSTTLLGVNEEQAHLLLDELTPKEGHQQLLKERQLTLSGRLEGVVFKFKCRLIQAKEEQGIAYYRMEIPRRLYYLQRRQDHRVPTANPLIPFRGLRAEDRQTLRGHLFDLSRRGVGVALDRRIRLAPGETLSNCIISLPDVGDLTFSLEVRFCSPGHGKSGCRFGGRMTGLDRTAQQKLMRAVAQLERLQAKRLHQL